MPASKQSIQSSKKPTANKPGARGARTTILHLCPDLEPGDPARMTVDLAVLTQRAGWRALIASSGGLLVPEAERAAVRHTRMPLDDNGMLAGWRNRIQLAALAQKERPVLIHAHGIEAAACALNIVRSQHLPLAVDVTNPLPDRRSTRRILKHLGAVTSAIRTPSQFVAQQLRDIFHWPADRLRVIPPGIDTQWYSAGAISAERLQALSRLWRLPEQAAIILAPMPFAPGGGHAQLLEALAHNKRGDIFAVLVGDNRPASGMRDDIDDLVTRFGLDGKVIMPDFCLDWPAACWLANIVVVANTTPRDRAFELLAAQAIGRPVIVSDCGANRELVQNDETAWIVPPDDMRALAGALHTAIGLDTAARLDLAARASAFVAEAFSQAGWFNATMDFYDSLLAPASAHRAKAAA